MPNSETDKGLPLWLLRPTQCGLDACDFDFMQGFLVRSENPQGARLLAQAAGGEETGNWGENTRPFWTEPEKASCTQVGASVGPRKAIEEIVIEDFKAF